MDVKTIIWIVSSVVILTVTGAIARYFANKKSKNNRINDVKKIDNQILKPSKMNLYVGCIGLVIMGLLMLVGWFLDTSTDLSTKLILLFTLFIPLLFLPLYLLFYYLNYKITLYEDHFVYQNFWRYKRTVNYKDIKIDNMKMYTTIQIKNKKGKFRNLFKLTPYLDNSDLFMDYYRNAKKKKFKTEQNKKM